MEQKSPRKPRGPGVNVDKARLFRTALPNRHRRANLARLLRSARKLDPQGRYLDSRAVAMLTTL